MNKRQAYCLKKLQRKYLVIRLGEISLIGIAIAILLYGVSSLGWVSNPLLVSTSLAAGAVAATIRFRALKLHLLNEHRIVAFIDRQYPALQQSTDLLLRDETKLTSLQRLQKEKIIRKFDAIYPDITFPHRLGQAALFLLLSFLVTAVLASFRTTADVLSDETQSSSSVKKKILPRLPVIVRDIRINIRPPYYTARPSFHSNDPNLTLPEGSIVHWQVSFSDSVKNPQLIFSAGETVKLDDNHETQRSFTKSTFYQLSWTLKTGEIKTSDYYKIEIIADKAPDITVHQLAQFTQVTVLDKHSIALRSTLSDDYAIQDAYVIATVSKGSGESVKFREEKLAFTSPAKIQGREVQASRTIDLVTLGLEPGDELYFYVEALDNKTPIANRARTETFFIALQDTASQQLSVEGGLGVDLMPEYFRSQRQIIIDSEKLLRDRKNITKHEFNARSNELGYDQKVLRLKYGEFLGEEFESAIGPGSELPVEDHDHEAEGEEDPKEKYGHVHDKGNEHNLVPDEKQQPAHTHQHKDELDTEKQENPADAYKHQHDDPEEATFFTQSIRAKLKAALTVMWDAELHLRMYDPAKSLPHQYTALKLLKEISNDSRIYVHKTGFDPPPLKEEKRLTGDRTELKNTKFQGSAEKTEAHPEMRRALLMIEQKLLEQSPRLSASEKQILLRAGNELSSLALEQPGQFLPALSTIKALTDDNRPENIFEGLMRIRKAFWQALPAEGISPSHEVRATHPLDHVFIKKMEALKND